MSKLESVFSILDAIPSLFWKPSHPYKHGEDQEGHQQTPRTTLHQHTGWCDDCVNDIRLPEAALHQSAWGHYVGLWLCVPTAFWPFPRWEKIKPGENTTDECHNPKAIQTNKPKIIRLCAPISLLEDLWCFYPLSSMTRYLWCFYPLTSMTGYRWCFLSSLLYDPVPVVFSILSPLWPGTCGVSILSPLWLGTCGVFYPLSSMTRYLWCFLSTPPVPGHRGERIETPQVPGHRGERIENTTGTQS